MTPNPVLHDVYIAYPAQVGPATHPRPSPGERGFFSRTDELRGAGWIAVNGNLADTECGRRRKVLPDFFLDVLRLSSIGARAVFLVALTILQAARPTCRRQPPLRDRSPDLSASCRPAGVLACSSLLRLDPDKSGRWARTLPRSWPPRTHRDRRCRTVLWSDKPRLRPRKVTSSTSTGS